MCPHCGQALDEHCLSHNLGNWPIGSLTRCPGASKWPTCGPTPPPPTALPVAYSCGCYDELSRLYLGPTLLPDADGVKAWQCSICMEKPVIARPAPLSPANDEA